MNASYRSALAVIASLALLVPFPLCFARADTTLLPPSFHGISALRLIPYLTHRRYASDGLSPVEPCLSSLEALLAVDCFKSEFEVNAHEEYFNADTDFGYPAAFTKIEITFETAPKARNIDLSPFELQAILAAYPMFQLRYKKLNGRRIQVRDRGDSIEVGFYDPDVSSGCHGDCGRGSMTVILSKPGLDYVRTVFPR